MDGVSFLPSLQGHAAKPREPIYIYYWPRPERGKPLRFARTHSWKLYGDGRLFNVREDVLEQTPVDGEDNVRKSLQSVLDRMPAKGQTLLRYD